jgi:hypothetical protein
MAHRWAFRIKLRIRLVAVLLMIRQAPMSLLYYDAMWLSIRFLAVRLKAVGQPALCLYPSASNRSPFDTR